MSTTARYTGAGLAGAAALAVGLALSGASPIDGYTTPAPAELDDVRRVQGEPGVCEGVVRFKVDFKTDADRNAAATVVPDPSPPKLWARVKGPCSAIGAFLSGACTLEHGFPDAASNPTWAAIRPADCP